MQPRGKTPEHQAVYERLRDSLVLGHFEPGEPLTIQKLTGFLQAGMTPVREAMRRLTAENALKTLGNRRVIVPILDRAEMDDIYLLRYSIESELAARASQILSAKDIATLLEIDAEVDLAISKGEIETYLERNRAFHFYIYERANSPILLRVVESLWAQVGPSLRVVCGRYGTASLPDKHQDLMTALAAKQAQAASDAIKADLQQGIDLACQSFPQSACSKPQEHVT